VLRIGLTGGLATGKSFVGKTLAECGCALLKADQLGHEVLSPRGEAYAAVLREFGAAILDSDGTINRRRLGTEVFGHPGRLARLNALVHPHVIAREERWMKAVEAGSPQAIAVVEAAILIETGSYRRFDRLVLTVCTNEQQIERAMKRDGMLREEVEERLRQQMPLEEKRKFAHYVVDTSQAKERTAEQVRTLYQELRSLTA
jgi:dephospho-CoA kinase